MFFQIRTILARSGDAVISDLAGVLLLGAMTVGMLHLPGLI